MHLDCQWIDGRPEPVEGVDVDHPRSDVDCEIDHWLGLGLRRLKKGGGRVEGELCHRKCFQFLGEGKRNVVYLTAIESFVVGVDYRLICLNYQLTIH